MVGGYKRCSDQMNTPLNGNVAWQKSVTKNVSRALKYQLIVLICGGAPLLTQCKFLLLCPPHTSVTADSEVASGYEIFQNLLIVIG